MTSSRTAAPTTSRRGGRGRARAAAVGIAIMIAVSAAACAPSSDSAETTGESAPQSRIAPAPSVAETPVPSPAAPAPAVGVNPARVVLPSIGIDSTLIDLGIQQDGSLEVPSDFDDIGWFTGGGKPGGRGPTVIAAHVDSPSGPAAFVRLGELTSGDRVIVTGVDGVDYEYEIYDSATYAKNRFPTADVFGATTTDELRLITCTGIFDTSIGHYDDNLVVSATRVLPTE